MHSLKGANIGLDRKILSELAIVDAAAFSKVVASAKRA
jgi:ribosomal protein L20